MKIEDIDLYLPKFLSAESYRILIKGLNDFPENIDTRLYTTYLNQKNLIYQGDGIQDLLVINLPKSEINKVPCMILSNTCDIDLHNKRKLPTKIVYTPIFNLEKFYKKLKSESKDKEGILSFIKSVKRQEVSQIFYLPKLNEKIDESIIFFDFICSCDNGFIDRENLKTQRLFTLSDYGSYLFIFKLSIHFTRIQDKVERRSIIDE
ncbi:MAG: hypothetical protein V1779_17430 [bacterium]